MSFWLDSLPFWIALVPLGVYCCVMGGLQLRHRPLVISAAWDSALLGLALSGLVAVGPLAAIQPLLGGSPWGEIILLLLYALVVAVCILFARPRLLIYNATVEQIRPLVAQNAAAVDPVVRWAGESVALPTLGLQAHVEGNGSLRTVSIVVLQSCEASEAWIDLSRRLRRMCRRLRVQPSPVGVVMLIVGCGLLLTAFILACGIM
jgi:hypothetical protein